MKHCPKCKENYVEKFDHCFRCDGDLEVGEVPEAPVTASGSPEEAPDVAEASMSFGKLAFQLVVILGALVVGAWVYNSVFGDIIRLSHRRRYILRGGMGGLSGVVRSMEERKALAATYKVIIPVFDPESEMVVWCVTEQKIGIPHLPELRYLVRDTREGGVVVVIGVSTSLAPGALQLDPNFSRRRNRRKRTPRSVITLNVAVADRVDGKVRFGVAQGYGGTKEEEERFDFNDTFEDRVLRGPMGKILRTMIALAGVGAFLLLLYILFT